MQKSATLCCLIGIVLAINGVAQAQVGKAGARLVPLVETEGIRAGGAVRLTLRVELPEGLHVQSNTPRDPALIPTVLTLEPPEGLQVEEIIYPAAVDLPQAGQDKPLAVYGRAFTIGIRARLAANVRPGEFALAGRLRYQACNEKVCFPPATIETEWVLEVLPRSAPTQHGDPFGALRRPARLIRVAATAGAEPAPTPRTLVAMVRAAMAGDFARAEAMVRDYRATHGVTPEMLLALSWLGRGALAVKNYAVAGAHAGETHALGLELLKRRGMDDESVFPTAFGAAIEVLGQVAAAQGRRSEAVAYLQDELRTYGGTSLHKRIQKNINLLSLEGALAPRLDLSEYLGAAPPTLASLQGRVVLLFFWAHWCSDCKAQGPVLERLLQRFGPQGLTILAPTQRFGYAAGGVPAPADAENAYIDQVRLASYPWLAQVPVPLAEANHQRFGVSSTPTLVLIDRAGIVRRYHPGQMTATQLETAVGELVAPAAPGA